MSNDTFTVDVSYAGDGEDTGTLANDVDIAPGPHPVTATGQPGKPPPATHRNDHASQLPPPRTRNPSGPRADRKVAIATAAQLLERARRLKTLPTLCGCWRSLKFLDLSNSPINFFFHRFSIIKYFLALLEKLILKNVHKIASFTTTILVREVVRFNSF